MTGFFFFYLFGNKIGDVIKNKADYQVLDAPRLSSRVVMGLSQEQLVVPTLYLSNPPLFLREMMCVSNRNECVISAI